MTSIKNISRWTPGPGWSLMALMLTLLVSCAMPQGQSKQETDPGVNVQLQGPTVVRLEGGGEGFIIKEIPEMDADARKAFDQAVAFIGGQQYQQAIDILAPVVAQSPGVTAPYINLAMAYEAAGEREKAKVHLQKALELIPDHPVACNTYGLLCRKTGDFTGAREYYEKAVASFPEYYPVHRNLGILCDLYLNDPACALKHYELYSAAKPEDEKVKLWIADLRNRMGDD